MPMPEMPAPTISMSSSQPVSFIASLPVDASVNLSVARCNRIARELRAAKAPFPASRTGPCETGEDAGAKLRNQPPLRLASAAATTLAGQVTCVCVCGLNTSPGYCAAEAAAISSAVRKALGSSAKTSIPRAISVA